MSVTVTSSRITISDEVVSLADIKIYADRVGQSDRVIVVNDYYYKIDVDILLINNAAIVDSKIILDVDCDYFTIEKGSRLELGKIREDGSTYDGCTVMLRDLRSTYGFGGVDKENSGDLLLYDTNIDAWCFWSFFEGENHIEIIDCTVRGYGRIAGSESILKNINFRYSHGTYGILSPAGELKEMINLNTTEVLEMYGRKCSLYYYPKLSGDMYIYYGTYGGYEHLAYILNSAGHNRLEFRGSNILDGYNLYRQHNNVDFFHSYRFNPRIIDIDGTPIPNVTIIVKDRHGEVVENVFSDDTGEVDLWIPYYQDIADVGTDILTPHSVEIRTDTLTMQMTINIDRNLNEFPITLQNQLPAEPDKIDYSKIQEMIDATKSEVLGKIEEVRTDVISGNSDISQVLLTLGEEVEENQTIIESRTGNTKLIL